MSAYSLAFSPLLPWSVLAAFALAGLVVTTLHLYAGRRGGLVRALALAVILTALADPSLVREAREPLKDVAAVVIDRSGSMDIGVRRAQADAARAALERELQRLGVEPRVVESGRDDALNDGTRLFASLNEALADVPAERIAGAILVTDGQAHDIPASPEALGFTAPLHALIVGREGERDRRIELIEAPRFGIVGKDQTIEARVLDTADRGEPAAIIVRRDGAEVARLRAAVGERVRIPVRIEHGGPNVIEIETPTLPDELTAINNRAVVTVEGVRDKLKVLLVSGEPHAGERTWRNLLKSDANVDLVHFTILRPPEKQDGTPINELSLIAFPTSDLFGRKITDFDLIIFDRYSNQSVLPPVYFENIVRYVREGGALLIAAGPDFSNADGLYYSPLGRISPARPDGRVIQKAFRAAVTEDGRKHPLTRDLPGSQANPPAWSEWFRSVGATATRGSVVLSGADASPLLVVSREQKGRVALLLSDQMWLWARGFEGGGPQLDLLRRLAHWLMKEPELEEEALRATVRGQDLAIERQSLKAEIGPVTITDPTGATRQIVLTQAEPGLWRGALHVDALGLTRLTDGALTALVNVGPENPREYQDLVSTPDKLAPLADATGGSSRRIGGVGEAILMPRLVAMRGGPLYAGSDFIGLKRTGASVVRGVSVAPVAIGLTGLLALLGVVIGAWLWEGRRRA